MTKTQIRRAIKQAADKNTYRVESSSEGWILVKPGGEMVPFHKKVDAVDAAKKIAVSVGHPTRLHVYHKTGNVAHRIVGVKK